MIQESAYDGYRRWKGWNNLFQPQPYETAMFTAEFSGITLLGKNLLDVGFGSGALLGWARSRGATVAGVEIQAGLREAAQLHGIRAYAELAEAGTGTYDLVTIFDVLEHLAREDILLLLSEIFRVTRPSAEVVIRVPNCQSPLGLINQLGDPTHLTMLSGPILGCLLEDAGFEVTATRDAVMPKFPVTGLRRLLRPLQWLAQKLFLLGYRFTWSTGSMPLAHNVLVIARRCV